MSDMVERVARIIANAMGDNYSDAFKNKERWNAKRGMSGGRIRDVNEPMQCDYLAAAEAAIAAMQADAAPVDDRVSTPKPVDDRGSGNTSDKLRDAVAVYQEAYVTWVSSEHADNAAAYQAAAAVIEAYVKERDAALVAEIVADLRDKAIIHRSKWGMSVDPRTEELAAYVEAKWGGKCNGTGTVKQSLTVEPLSNSKELRPAIAVFFDAADAGSFGVEPCDAPTCTDCAKAAAVIEADRAALVAEISALRTAADKLAGYAGHDDDCEIMKHGVWTDSIPCTCGYTDAWWAYEAAKQASK